MLVLWHGILPLCDKHRKRYERWGENRKYKPWGHVKKVRKEKNNAL